MGVALRVPATLCRGSASTLPEAKGNCAIIEGIFQEEVSHTGLAGSMMERFLD